MRIVDFFDAATERFRDQRCLVHGDESWTYREVQSLSRRAAKGWQSLGVGPGDRVIVWGPNVDAGAELTRSAGFGVRPMNALVSR